MRQFIALILISALVSNTACAFGRKRGRVMTDAEPTPFMSNDSTAIVRGGANCDTLPHVGFAYCRFSEGDVATEQLTFVGPPASCNKDGPCAFVKVANKDGQIVWGSGIPRGQTEVSVSWKELIGSDQFTVGPRGHWSWSLEVFWKDEHGTDRRSLATGDILLRIFKKGYKPLNRVEDDPNFVWEWTQGDFVYKMTSSLRAFVGKAE